MCERDRMCIWLKEVCLCTLLCMWDREEERESAIGQKYKSHVRTIVASELVIRLPQTQFSFLISISQPKLIKSQDVWRRCSRSCRWQWLRNVQGRIRRRWCSPRCLPLHCWSPPPPGLKFHQSDVLRQYQIDETMIRLWQIDMIRLYQIEMMKLTQMDLIWLYLKDMIRL